MKHILNKSNKKQYIDFLKYLIYVFLFIIIIVQGLDLTDEGYLLTLWKFSNLREIYDVNMRFLGTILFGGTLFKLGVTKFIYFRFINFLLIAVAFFLYTRNIKGKFRLDHLLILFVFVVGSKFSVVHYNTLSIFFIILFWVSLKFKNNFIYYISGIIFCLFLFVKINNMIFLPITLFYIYFSRDIKSFVQFLLGLFIGGVFVLMQLHYFIGLGGFIQAVEEHIYIISNFKDPNYNLLFIIKQYVRDWLFVLFIFPLALAGEKLTFLTIKLKHVSLILILVLFYQFQKENMLYSLVFYGLLIVYYKKGLTLEEMIFSFSVMVLLPLGSAEGLNSIAYVSLLPGFAILFLNTDYLKTFFISDNLFLNKWRFDKLKEWLLIFFCAIFLFFSGAWFDGPRYKLTSTQVVGENVFFTRSDKASIIRELQMALSKHGLDKKDRILFFESTPMFYFMFDIKPLYGQPWVHISSPSYLKHRLNQDEDIDAIVRFKGQPLGGNWIFADPAVSDTTAQHTFARNPKHLKVLRGYLKKDNFKLRGDYELFEIWLK